MKTTHPDQDKTQGGFDRQKFKQQLSCIPKGTLIEMAHDGIIDIGEVHRLLTLMGLSPEEVGTMQPHFHLIGETVLRYIERSRRQNLHQGTVQLTGMEAAQIMEKLLNRGLISRYYARVVEPKMQLSLPGRNLSQEIQRT